MRYHIISDSNISPFKIYSMGFSGDSSVTRFGPGRRNLYIIHYVLKGKGYFNGNAVKEGQGFLISPNQPEEYYGDKNEPWEFLWIISDDSGMKNIFERYNANPDTDIFNHDAVPEIKKIANEIMSLNNQIVDSLKMLEMFLRVINSHMNKKLPVRHKPNSQVYLDFCVDYIESNIHKKITVGELSELLGVSQPYLYKLFVSKFNVSTKQYILWHKINRAKKLLAETDMSITEIANSVGYSDVLDFSKLFYAKEGISPKQYRMTIS